MHFKFGHNLIFTISLENMNLHYQFLWKNIFFYFQFRWKKTSHMKIFKKIVINIFLPWYWKNSEKESSNLELIRGRNTDTSFNQELKEERPTIHVLFIWIHLVIHFPFVCLLFSCEYSSTDKEIMNFPVCSWISLWVFTQPTKKTLISLCVHNFPWEFLHNLQVRLNFPVCSIISLWVFRQPTRKIEFPCGFLEKHSGKFGTHREKRFPVVTDDAPS